MAAQFGKKYGEKERQVKAAFNLRSINDMMDQVDDFLLQWSPVEQLSAKTSLRPCYFIPLALAGLMMFLGLFDAIITYAVGFFYPAWQSFKAIETHRSDDDKQWLTYWVVFALFTFIEIFSSSLLFWVPFYYLIKIAFLLWLILPQFQGAVIVYNSLIRPIFLQHFNAIQGVIDQVAGPASEAADTAKETLRRRMGGSPAED